MLTYTRIFASVYILLSFCCFVVCVYGFKMEINSLSQISQFFSAAHGLEVGPCKNFPVYINVTNIFKDKESFSLSGHEGV